MDCDYISASAGIVSGRQQLGPNDRWSTWGQPAGSTLTTSGAMWGVYPGTDNAGAVTIWDGIGPTDTDTDAQQSDSIDGGAGNDWIVVSWGSDRLQGGAGDDQIDVRLDYRSKLSLACRVWASGSSLRLRHAQQITPPEEPPFLGHSHGIQN